MITGLLYIISSQRRMVYMSDEESKSREELMREFDLGKGISVSMGIGDNIDYFFTNKVEGIKAKSRKELGELEVEISSTQADDEELLKRLSASL